MEHHLIYFICIAVGWLITEFEPLHFVLSAVKEKLPKHELIEYLFSSFSCWQCMTLWGGWIISGDVVTAILSAFGSFVLESWLSKR